MNASEVLRIVDSLHREKNIEKEVVFRAIESALSTAARKHFGEEADIEFPFLEDPGDVLVIFRRVGVRSGVGMPP